MQDVRLHSLQSHKRGLFEEIRINGFPSSAALLHREIPASYEIGTKRYEQRKAYRARTRHPDKHKFTEDPS